MSYLKSNQVKSIYPSAYRNAIFDLQADNTTEYNMINAIKRIGKRNYIVNWDAGITGDAVALRVSLGGYLFEITGQGVATLKSAAEAGNYNDIYLYIRTASSDGTSNNAQLLPADDTSTSVSSLDTTDSADTSNFQGLGYSFSIPAGKTGYLLILHKTGSTWAPPSVSYVILDTAEIGDGVTEPSEKTIAERFTTQNLIVNGSTTFNGDITQTSSYKINGVRLDAQTTGYTISGGTTTSKTLDLQANTTVKDVVNINQALTVGELSGSGATYTGDIEIKGKKNLTIVGASSSNQTETFNGTSTFQAGNYASAATGGSEQVTVGGNSFNIMTRDTLQEINSHKKFVSGGILLAPTIYGNYTSCSTDKATAVKEVSLTNFSLINNAVPDGTHIFVRFAASNTAVDAQLRINNNDYTKKYIYKTSIDKVGITLLTSWNNNEVVELVYDSSLGSNAGGWLICNKFTTASTVLTTKKEDTTDSVYLIGSTVSDTSDDTSLYKTSQIYFKNDSLTSPNLHSTNSYTSSNYVYTNLYVGRYTKEDTTIGYKCSINASGEATLQKITLPTNTTQAGTDSDADMLGTAKRSVADKGGSDITTTYAHGLTASSNSISLNNKGGTSLNTVSFVVCSGNNAATEPAAINSTASVKNNTMTITLGTSGVTAGKYGDGAEQSPGFGGTFKVPTVTVNDRGIVTGISAHSIKLPAKPDDKNDVTKLTDGTSQGTVNWTFNGSAQTAVSCYNLGTTGTPTFKTVTATTSFNTTSDLRLKENIKSFIPHKSILDLDVVEFDLKKDGSHHIGCIAQELQKICPEIVQEDKEGYLSIEESKIVYLLLEEVKQLKKKIDNMGD